MAVSDQRARRCAEGRTGAWTAGLAVAIAGLLGAPGGCGPGVDASPNEEAPDSLAECESDLDCEDAACDQQIGRCRVPDSPCAGLACGGLERGVCLDDGTCDCADGYGAGVVDGLCCAVEGDDPICGDVEPAPGRPGGLCLAPDGRCEQPGLECDVDQNFCYDPQFPCLGFICGGLEPGTCVPEGGAPTCQCAEGYENETFPLYCCPTDGSDPLCV